MPVGLLIAAKDRLLSRTVRNMLNRQYARYGTITRLAIDSRRKTISGAVQLQGETEETTVTGAGYSVRKTGDQHRLHLGACTASRTWLQRLLEDHVASRPVPLPREAHRLL